MLRIALVCAVLCTAGLAAGDGAPAAPIIRPGQEALLGEMLGHGAALPAGCTLAGVEIRFAVVEATYDCPYGASVIRLVHPDEGPAAAVETAQFAVSIERGAPPEGLVDALAALIAAGEDDFEWRWPGGGDLDPPDDADANPGSDDAPR